MYKESPFGLNPIDFNEPKNPPRPHGHCLACRITAENPDEGFKPNSGTVQELTFRCYIALCVSVFLVREKIAKSCDMSTNYSIFKLHRNGLL